MQVSFVAGVRTGVDALETDGAFWRIFDFSFIDGKPYSDAEAKSGLPVAVITESVARLLFRYCYKCGRERDFCERCPLPVKRSRERCLFNGFDGLCTDMGPIFSTNITGGDNVWSDGIMGAMRVVILACSSSYFDAIRAECERSSFGV